MVAPLLLLLAWAAAAQAVSYPTAVVEVVYGPGAGFGQDHVPDNVLGPPDPDATPQVPCADPAQLLALGTEGWIVLHFADGIVDGPGPDFTIYENVMQLGGDPPAYFREAGVVAVSDDGQQWTEIPFDTSSGQGLAGWRPTQGAAVDPDWQSGGGDPMDLAWAGVASARYVRIRDAGPRVQDGGSSFDLDAVRVWHDESLAVAPAAPAALPALATWPNPFNNILTLGRLRADPARLRVYDLAGRLLLERQVSGRQVRLDAAGLPAGLLLVELDEGGAGRRAVSVLHVE